MDMKKAIMTRYCISGSETRERKVTSFEERFERYVEKKVKKILDYPEKYPFITVIDGEKANERD